MKKVSKSRKENLEQYDFAWNTSERIFSEKLNYPERIGEFLISFSNLESSLNILIAEIINDSSHELGYQIIKTLTYNNKVQLSKDLYLRKINSINNEILRKKSKNEFERIILYLIELGSFRNKVAHANWLTLDNDGYVRVKIEQDSGGGVEFLKVKITPRVLSDFSMKCDRLANKVYSFPDKISARINLQ